MRDTPFLRAYKIDYLSASRNVMMKSTASTLFGGGASAGGGAASGPTSTGATATIDVKAENNLWDSIVLNVKEILRETDKVVPAAATLAAPVPPPVAPGAGQSASAAGPAAPPSAAYQEATSVIANRESGVLYVRATSKQHEKVQEFLDQVMAGAKRQILVEATVAAEGFMMAVLPQINETDGVVLNVRPTIRRQVASARDPNPALQGLATQNDIPLFETREFDSILRLQSGEIAVLAGLMQDQVENTVAGIPGVRSIPIIGDALSTRSDLTTKTELVIFLRATVIRDPSIDGDFRKFRDQLPAGDFFTKPNPGRIAAPVGPEPLR